jgi:hypothetical protein
LFGPNPTVARGAEEKGPIAPMSGRHCKPPTPSRSAAKLAVTGAVIGGSGFTLAGTATAATDVEWDQVARCESSGNWAIDTGNGFQGGLQFLPSTWSSYGGGQFAMSANLATRDQQIAVAERVLAGQGRGAWPVCGHGLSGATPRNVVQDAKSTPAVAPIDNAPPAAAPPRYGALGPAATDDVTPAAAPQSDNVVPFDFQAWLASLFPPPPAPEPEFGPAVPEQLDALDVVDADDVAPFDFQAWLASLFPPPPAPEPEFRSPVPEQPEAREVVQAVGQVPVPLDSSVAPPGSGGDQAPTVPTPHHQPSSGGDGAVALPGPQDHLSSGGAQTSGVQLPPDPPAYDTASGPTPNGIEIPPDGVPHLSSPDNLPPGTTSDPDASGRNPNISYLRQLWTAVQTQEISGKDALLALTQLPLTNPQN